MIGTDCIGSCKPCYHKAPCDNGFAIISQKHSIKLLPACLAEEQFSEADLNNFVKNKYNTFFYITIEYQVCPSGYNCHDKKIPFIAVIGDRKRS
jgi:hypothetical protein